MIGGHGGGVAERLVVSFREPGERLLHVLRSHHVLVMVRAEVLCRNAGVIRFVVSLDRETDGVRARRLARDLFENSDDRGAVGAAAQEGPDLAAGRRQAGANRVADSGAVLLGKLGLSRGALVLVPGRPVTGAADIASARERVLSGLEALDSLENAPRSRDHVEVDVVENRLRVDFLRYVGM